MDETVSFIPRYDETQEQAAEYLRLALPLLAKFQLPVNPLNYAIGYHYVAGYNPELRQAIDRLLQDHRSLTQESCIRLYKEHILDAAARRFEKVGSSLQHLVHNTLEEVETAERRAAASGNALEQQAEVLNRQPPDRIAEMLRTIIDETRSLAKTGHKLRTHLRTTHREIEQLRAELEMMKEVAFTDGLTGLLNRRAFDIKIRQVLQNPEPETTFLLLLDLDHFKKINDRHGHLTGDKVLRYTARIIKRFLPKGQTAARYGGEEMAILLSRCQYRDAFHLAEQIRKTLADSKLQRRGSQEPIGQVTLSIGIAALRPDDTVDSFIERADQALYQAKRLGRNRVVDDRAPIHADSA